MTFVEKVSTLASQEEYVWVEVPVQATIVWVMRQMGHFSFWEHIGSNHWQVYYKVDQCLSLSPPVHTNDSSLFGRSWQRLATA